MQQSLSKTEMHRVETGSHWTDSTRAAHSVSRRRYAHVPYSSLESVIEATKDGYYLALRRTQGTIRSDAPAWEPWIAYFPTSLQRQKVRLEAKILRE